MILFLFLVILVAGTGLLIRRQMYFQHREILKTINPEQIAREDAITRAREQKLITLFVGILIFFGLLFLVAFCAQFKGFGPGSGPAPQTEMTP